MANTFSNAFVRGYNSAVYETVNIQGRAFMGKTDERDQTGELEFYETLGSVYANTERDGAFGSYDVTPIMDAAHDKRVCAQVDSDIGMTINKLDEVKALATFESRYVKRMAQALNRQRDIEVIRGALGTAATGKLATGTAAFDFANQTIAVGTGGTGAQGMNVDKLRAIRAKFLKSGYSASDEFYVALTGAQLSDLQSDDKFTSFDYNNSKPLTTGEVGSFLGITVVQSEQLPFILDAGGVNLNWDATDKPVDEDDNSTRACFAWVKNALLVGTNPNIKTEVDKDPYHKFNFIAYSCQGVGAVRMEEPGVQLVPCLEA